MVTGAAFARRSFREMGRGAYKGMRSTGMHLLQVQILVPTRDRQLLTKRVHNEIAKRAIRLAMENFHQKIIPQHFMPSAASVYGHKRRMESYIRRKQRRFGNRLDLIKTGGTAREMIGHKEIIIGGTAEGSDLRGKLRLRFGFADDIARSNREKYSRPKRRFSLQTFRAPTAGVDLAQMKKEITTLTDHERESFAKEVLKHYMTGYHAHAATRQRARKIHN